MSCESSEQDLERERKFVIEALPEEVAAVSGDAIDQGYLAIGEGGEEVRVRRRAGQAWLTAKQGRGMVRREVEIALTLEQFERFWPLTEGRRVEKVRRVIPTADGARIEVDVYGGALSGLTVAEVEFDDADAARAFAPPAWFGAEVTDDDAYKNRRLAVGGRP